MIAVKILAIVLGVVVVVVALGVILATVGSPKACADRTVVASSAASRALQSKWDQFKLEAGSRRTTVTLNEAEVTSRGREYISSQGVAVDNLEVFLCREGYGQATGKYTGAGVGIDVLVQGTLDLTGPEPRLDVQKMEAGKLPGFVTTGMLVSALSEDDKTLRVGVKLISLSYGEGQVTLTGGP